MIPSISSFHLFASLHSLFLPPPLTLTLSSSHSSSLHPLTLPPSSSRSYSLTLSLFLPDAHAPLILLTSHTCASQSPVVAAPLPPCTTPPAPPLIHWGSDCTAPLTNPNPTHFLDCYAWGSTSPSMSPLSIYRCLYLGGGASPSPAFMHTNFSCCNVWATGNIPSIYL